MTAPPRRPSEMFLKVKNTKVQTKTFKLEKDIYIFFLNILFLYLTQRERAQAGGVAGRGRGREIGFRLSKEPDMGRDTRTPGP